MQKFLSGLGVFLLFLLVPICILFGLAIMEDAGKHYPAGRSNWPTATAITDNTRLEKRQGSYKGRPVHRWCVIIDYSYAATPASDALQHGSVDECFFYKIKASSLRQEYPAGKSLRIHVNPDMPQQSYLPGVGEGNKALAIAAGLSFWTFGVILSGMAVFLVRFIGNTSLRNALFASLYLFGIPASFVWYQLADSEIGSAKRAYSLANGTIKSVSMGAEGLVRGWCPEVVYRYKVTHDMFKGAQPPGKNISNGMLAEVRDGYTVISSAHEGKHLMIGDWCSSDQELARKVLAMYSPGQPVKVHYRTRNPARSTLSTDVSRWLHMERRVSLALLLVLLWMAWRMYKSWVERTTPSTQT